MGALDEQGKPIARPADGAKSPKDERTSASAQYLREVRDEMRKVAWPTRAEVRRYSIIVLITVVVYTAFVGGLDFLFGVFSGWLYD